MKCIVSSFCSTRQRNAAFKPEIAGSQRDRVNERVERTRIQEK